MITNKVTVSHLLNVRITLALLWVAGMLSSLNGDTYRLSDPAVLKSSLANSGPMVATPALLLVMSLLFVGSIFMCALTLMFKPALSRWANRIVGIFYGLITLVFEGLHLFVWHSTGYEIVWATAQCVFALLVVWYAWRWTNLEG